MIKKIVGLLLALALTAGACESADSSTDTSDTGAAATQTDESNEAPNDDSGNDKTADDDDTETFSGDDNSEFCKVAREFDENDPFENSAIPDEEFFNAAEALWNDVLDIAPSDIKGDFETTLSSLQDFKGIMEKYDYEFFDEDLIVELDALDSTASDAAGARISAYLEDVCGIVGGLDAGDDDTGFELPDGLDAESLENIDPAAVEGIFDALGVDAETAACLNEEFGDDFDLENPDLSILTEPVCGTTLMEIITNIGQG